MSRKPVAAACIRTAAMPFRCGIRPFLCMMRGQTGRAVTG
jgi:hypothetical protein